MRFRRASGRPEPRIEITPLIDVVFQLLIFFLVTTSFVDPNTLEVELPAADTAAQRREPNVILVLTILEGGEVVYRRRTLDDEAIVALFRDAAGKHPAGSDREPIVLLRADRNVPHGDVVRVMDLALAQRINRLAIATRTADERL